MCARKRRRSPLRVVRRCNRGERSEKHRSLWSRLGKTGLRGVGQRTARLAMIAAGVGVGIVGAWAAGRVLEHVVAGIGPGGPATFAAMVSLLVAAALLASFLPARRASRVDPMRALRQD